MEMEVELPPPVLTQETEIGSQASAAMRPLTDSQESIALPSPVLSQEVLEASITNDCLAIY